MNDLTIEFGLATPEQVAKLRGIATSTLANERAQGRGPAFVKLGSKVMYPRAGLRKYIEQNTITPERSRSTLVTGKQQRRRRA